jgi:hypothetical protein
VPACDTHFLSTVEAAQLFGRSVAAMRAVVEAGDFFKPDAWHGVQPLWQRGLLEEAANEHWSKHPVPLVWRHPRTWRTAEEAAREQAVYRQLGALIFGNGESFHLHVPAGSRPASKLRLLRRYGSNIAWTLREFLPESVDT